MVGLEAEWCVAQSCAFASSDMHDFRRLRVWQCSRELAVAVSLLARRFPRVDRGVVATQLRRAAHSIPSNIAEGCGKSSRKDSVRFLQMACASALEAENHVLIAGDLGYIAPQVREDLTGKLQAIQRMLCSLMNKFPDR
jgi:four helix bundle protein